MAGQELGAPDGMLLHHPPFAVSELAWPGQHRLRNLHLADVVQHGGQADAAGILPTITELKSEVLGHHAHAVQMAACGAVMDLGGSGEQQHGLLMRPHQAVGGVLELLH